MSRISSGRTSIRQIWYPDPHPSVVGCDHKNLNPDPDFWKITIPIRIFKYVPYFSFILALLGDSIWKLMIFFIFGSESRYFQKSYPGPEANKITIRIRTTALPYTYPTQGRGWPDLEAAGPGWEKKKSGRKEKEGGGK